MSTKEVSAVPAFTAPKMNKRQIMLVMSGLMLVMLLAVLDQTVVSTALWTIVKDLDPVHGINHLSWVITSYLLASTATQPLYGKISDMYGRKPVFMIAIVLFLLGSVVCGLSQNMTQLILFRGLQGLGAGGLMSLVMAIIGDMIPPREMGTGTAATGFFRNLGGAIGSAAFGALLSSRLAANLPHGNHAAGAGTPNVAAIHQLPAAVQHVVFVAFTKATNIVFLVAAITTVVGFVLVLFLKEMRLRSHEDKGNLEATEAVKSEL